MDKRCSKCGETKDLSEFHAHPNCRGGYRNKCRDCTNLDRRQRHARIAPSLNEARRARRASDPVATAKEREARNHWYAVNRDRYLASLRTRYASDPLVRKQHSSKLRQWKYGITDADYKAMLDAQGGRCAICQRTESETRGRFNVDHDHATGLVRGILCSGCNLALGLLGDSVDRLLMAVDYLRHRSGEVSAAV